MSSDHRLFRNSFYRPRYRILFGTSSCLPIVITSSLNRQHHLINSTLLPRRTCFFYLCRTPLLFNNNTQSFALDKWSGKKCFMLGARMLIIAWGDNPEYWSWESVPESRFPETAQLDSVCWLDIKGKLPTTFLSSNTTYGAYFVFQKVDQSFDGFYEPVKTYVLEANEEELSKNNDDRSFIVNQRYLEEPEDDGSSIRPEELPIKRGDGWIEVEMGRYRVGSADERVVFEMTLKEVEQLNWKSGVLVQGIELRPLD